MYKRKPLFFLLFYLVCTLNTLSAITQSDIDAHKQQFIDRLLESADVLPKQQPRVYTPQELVVMTEGRFCFLDPAQNRLPYHVPQIFELTVGNGASSPDHRQNQADQNQVSQTLHLTTNTDQSYPFKSPYTHDGQHQQNQLKPEQQRQQSFGQNSTTRHQLYFTITHTNGRRQRDPRMQASIARTTHSFAQRVASLQRIEKFNDTQIVNYLFGTSFNAYSSHDDFKDFIYDHADELLNRYDLYSSARYHDFLYWNVPGYQQHLEQLQKALGKSSAALNDIATEQRLNKTQLKKRIAQVHNAYKYVPSPDHSQQVNRWKFAKQLSASIKNHEVNRTQAALLLNEYHQMLDENDDEHQESLPLSARYQKRADALVATYNNGELVISQNEYELSERTKSFITQNGLDLQDFSKCLGSPISQQLHQEILSALDQACAYQEFYKSQACDYFAQIIAQHADVACAYNYAGNVMHATHWTDTCWQLLDYSHAVAEGLFEGTVNAACFAALATVAPIIPQVMLAGTCGYIAGKSLWTLSDLARAYYDGGPKAVRKELKQYKQKCQQYIDGIDKQLAKLEPRDKIRATTALVTEIAITPKMLKAVRSVHQATLRETTVLLKKVKEKASLLKVTDLLYKIADTTPQPGYVDIPNLNQAAVRKAAQLAAKNYPLCIHTQLINHPWLQRVLSKHSVMRMKRHGAIMEAYPGDIPEKTKFYIMTAAVKQEVVTGIKKINGAFHLTQETQNALGTIKFFSISEQRLAHILGIELAYDIKKKLPFFSGFHYDPNGTLKNIGIVDIIKPVEDQITKVIRSSALLAQSKKSIDNINSVLEKAKTKTFFPTHWSVEDILNKAQEALKNISKDPQFKYGKYLIIGETSCGVTIQFVVDSMGSIISFYPL